MDAADVRAARLRYVNLLTVGGPTNQVGLLLLPPPPLRMEYIAIVTIATPCRDTIVRESTKYRGGVNTDAAGAVCRVQPRGRQQQAKLRACFTWNPEVRRAKGVGARAAAANVTIRIKSAQLKGQKVCKSRNRPSGVASSVARVRGR